LNALMSWAGTISRFSSPKKPRERRKNAVEPARTSRRFARAGSSVR
jgi:hypothetical protein